MAEIPDAMIAAKNVAKLILENEKVRVMEFRIKPGKKAIMHNHPNPHVVHFMTNTRLKLTTPDAKADKLTLKAGQTIWMEPGSHEAENIGKILTHYLVVEVKHPSAEAVSQSDSS